MDLVQRNGHIIIENIKDFEPKHVFECGQCFRWDREEDNSYTVVANRKVINVILENNNLIIKNSNIDDVEEFWIDYFDLKKDYEKIKKELSNKDKNLKNATEFGYGIRLLNQDFYETVISFIISARNSIPSIKRSIKLLSEMYGEKIDDYMGKNYYSFPEINRLKSANLEEIKKSKVAFRAKYIIETCKKISEEKITNEEFENLTLDETSERLIKFPGVGPKVADCIALFSLKKYDSFPVDVWVNRVMSELYFKDEKLSLKKLREKSLRLFGEKAGFAQQYLFYYAREKGIGKSKKIV